jgi:ribonuclease HI
MSDAGVFTIHTDGAARGNPGPAAFAYVIEQNGSPPIEVKGTLGETTNNVAEYTALLRALEHAKRLGARRVLVHSDSELMVNQMQGKYKVKHEGLRPLYEEARGHVAAFDEVTFRHVRREQNGRADRLCNEALDGDAKAAPRPAAKKKAAPAQVDSGRADAVRQEALDCLRAVAAAWARGNPNEPKPEDVWEQLWTILEDGGVLRATRPR